MSNIVKSTLRILKCFVGEDEKLAAFKLIEKSKYKLVTPDGNVELTKKLLEELLLDTKDRTFLLLGSIPYGTYPPLEEFLRAGSIPFCRWTDICEDFSPEIVVFDGVRVNAVSSNTEGDALVDMRALRSIIDMLEEDREILALSYSNENWVETDVNNMWRFGMEAVAEFSTADKANIDIIDTEVIGENNGEQ